MRPGAVRACPRRTRPFCHNGTNPLPTPQIDIIIPVLNDLRVLDAVESICFFDDCDSVRIVIMAGSSSDEFLATVQAALRPGDDLCTEPDTGIFDALNKGLDRCTAPIIGWLGADDIFTGHVRASEVIDAFSSGDVDVLVYSTEYHVNRRITRKLRAGLSRKSLVRWGFHNGHFSTFLHRSVYETHRFKISQQRRNLFSDIEFFADLLVNAKVVTRDAVSTYMAEGGSASGTMKSVKVNFEQRFHLYRRQFGLLSGVLAPSICLAWKIASVVKYKLAPRECRTAWEPHSSPPPVMEDQ